MKTLKFFAFLLAATATITFTSCSDDDDDDVTVIDFENIELPKEGYINNKPMQLEGITFYNKFTSEWGSWEGFSFSNCNDITNADYSNQYSVYSNGGADKSEKFAVAFAGHEEPTHFKFPDGQTKTFRNVMVNNSTVTALIIKNGNTFSKKFESGDWFKVIFTGYNAAGEKTSEKPVVYYLADFQDGKNYICKDWKEVNLESLGKVNKITVTFDSSDKGQYGVNTPQYVCLDNLTYYND